MVAIPKFTNSYVEQAVKRAQLRHGVPPTGFLDAVTLDALNVPASARLRQLRTNLTRLQTLVPAAPTGKYVLVNIPAAQIEAVNNNQVVSRHTGVVGSRNGRLRFCNRRSRKSTSTKSGWFPQRSLKPILCRRAATVRTCSRNTRSTLTLTTQPIRKVRTRPDPNRLGVGRAASLFLRAECGRG